MKTYNISFNGYWLEKGKNDIPSHSGVYLVYRGNYRKVTNTVDLNEIIYIGQSVNVNERLSNHDHQEAFVKTLKPDETLCYSYAAVEPADLDYVENALIIAQRPRLNEIAKQDLDYSGKRFVLTGKCELLKFKDFTITTNTK